METDECGGPEFFSNGTKVLLVPGENGKVDPVAIDHVVTRRADIHYPKPKVLSITNHFAEEGKLLAAICHGGWIPISAGVMQDVGQTGSPVIRSKT